MLVVQLGAVAGSGQRDLATGEGDPGVAGRLAGLLVEAVEQRVHLSVVDVHDGGDLVAARVVAPQLPRVPAARTQRPGDGRHGVDREPASAGVTWVVTVPTVTVIGACRSVVIPRASAAAAAIRSRPPMSTPATDVPRGTLPLAPAYAATQPVKPITRTTRMTSRTARPPSDS